jgi:D-glycero-alpha-D-manno-heptose-7-phosphate kinase
MVIQALSPTRVDIAGGTLDITPMTQILQHRQTVNFGVTLHARVEIEKSAGTFRIASDDQGRHVEGSFEDVTRAGTLPWLEKLLAYFWRKEWTPLNIRVQAKSPAGAGLGGSSCLGIAMASALLKAREDIGQPLKLTDHQLVQTVQDLETGLIRVPTGCQDYWGGLRGGINIISYPPGAIDVQTLRDSQTRDLQDLLLLCYSGVSRASGTNNWAIFRRAFEGDQTILGILNEIGTLSECVAKAVLAGQWSEVFKLSSQEWQLRTRMWSDIETAETRRISAAAQGAGAMFSRICGAGGGGVMAIFAEPPHHAKVKAAVQDAGGQILDGTVSFKGTEVQGSL